MHLSNNKMGSYQCRSAPSRPEKVSSQGSVRTPPVAVGGIRNGSGGSRFSGDRHYGDQKNVDGDDVSTAVVVNSFRQPGFLSPSASTERETSKVLSSPKPPIFLPGSSKETALKDVLLGEIDDLDTKITDVCTDWNRLNSEYGKLATSYVAALRKHGAQAEASRFELSQTARGIQGQLSRKKEEYNVDLSLSEQEEVAKIEEECHRRRETLRMTFLKDDAAIEKECRQRVKNVQNQWKTAQASSAAVVEFAEDTLQSLALKRDQEVNDKRSLLQLHLDTKYDELKASESIHNEKLLSLESEKGRLLKLLEAINGSANITKKKSPVNRVVQRVLNVFISPNKQSSPSKVRVEPDNNLQVAPDKILSRKLLPPSDGGVAKPSNTAVDDQNQLNESFNIEIYSDCDRKSFPCRVHPLSTVETVCQPFLYPPLSKSFKPLHIAHFWYRDAEVKHGATIRSLGMVPVERLVIRRLFRFVFIGFPHPQNEFHVLVGGSRLGDCVKCVIDTMLKDMFVNDARFEVLHGATSFFCTDDNGREKEIDCNTMNIRELYELGGRDGIHILCRLETTKMHVKWSLDLAFPPYYAFCHNKPGFDNWRDSDGCYQNCVDVYHEDKKLKSRQRGSDSKVSFELLSVPVTSNKHSELPALE